MNVDRVTTRLLGYVEPQANGCWLWTGYVNRDGYGATCARPDYNHVFAHRLAYELLVGPIPDGLRLDHVCHNGDLACGGGTGCLHRRCINPAHLEPVTAGDNVRRSPFAPAGRNAVATHCIHGHEFTPDNTYTYTYRGRAKRCCRTCRYTTGARYKARLKAAAA